MAEALASYRRQRTTGRFLFVLAMAFYLVIALFPFYWMTVTSFKNATQINMVEHPFWPRPFVLENYTGLIKETNFTQWFKNSVMVAGLSTLFSMFIGGLAAYSLVRLRYSGQEFLASSVLFVYLIPRMVLFIPLYGIVRSLGIMNTRTALVVTFLTFTVPFFTWALMGYFRTIPRELEECAMIDGCSRLGAFVRILLPLSIPGVMAACLIAFNQAWNEFIYALVFVSSSVNKTVPIGLSEMLVADVYPWGQLMAGGVLTAIPIVIFYMYLQKYLVQGLTAGAVKG